MTIQTGKTISISISTLTPAVPSKHLPMQLKQKNTVRVLPQMKKTYLHKYGFINSKITIDFSSKGETVSLSHKINPSSAESLLGINLF